MKCENCEAMQNTSYEYQEWECVLGIEETEFKDGSCGCRKKEKTIKKMLENMYDAQCQEYGEMADFFMEQEKKDNALAKAIKEELFCDNKCICIKNKDGSFYELNLDNVLKNHCWEIRSKFEELISNNNTN